MENILSVEHYEPLAEFAGFSADRAKGPVGVLAAFSAKLPCGGGARWSAHERRG